jgi:uncharacterized protein DUF4388
MSLVGSLEDLGLADILQIVSLARKSGVLVLRSEDGEGRIVFREGLVHAAVVKGQPEDLDGLLRRPEGSGSPASDAPGPERIEALRRELVEQSLARMFEWRTGDFSFDVHDDPSWGAGLVLSMGLSPQYLTMEATRRNDERRAGVSARGDDALVFSGEDESDRDPLAALVDAVLDRSDPLAEAPLAGRETRVAPDRPRVERAACAHVVIVDPDLTALEWLKTTLAGRFERLHLFQSAEGGIARIRQYLSRGEVPAVLLSAHAPMDPLSGIDTVADLLRRLRAQAPRMPLLLVAEEGSPTPRAARLADGVLVRPTPAALLDPRSPDRVAAAARAVCSQLAPFTRSVS